MRTTRNARPVFFLLNFGLRSTTINNVAISVEYTYSVEKVSVKSIQIVDNDCYLWVHWNYYYERTYKTLILSHWSIYWRLQINYSRWANTDITACLWMCVQHHSISWKMYYWWNCCLKKNKIVMQKYIGVLFETFEFLPSLYVFEIAAIWAKR